MYLHIIVSVFNSVQYKEDNWIITTYIDNFSFLIKDLGLRNTSNKKMLEINMIK